MYADVPYCGDSSGSETVVANTGDLVWFFVPPASPLHMAEVKSGAATFFRSHIEPGPSPQYMLPGDVYKVPSGIITWQPDYTRTAEWIGLSEALEQLEEYGDKVNGSVLNRFSPHGAAAYECGKSAATSLIQGDQIVDAEGYIARVQSGVQISQTGAKCTKLLNDIQRTEAEKLGQVPSSVSKWQERTNKWTSTNQFVDDVLKGLKNVIRFCPPQVCHL
jgi:hypothetical protein